VTEFGAELDRWAAELGVGDDVRRRLLLAWDELASNVVRYATGATEIRIGIRPRAAGGVELVLEDDGMPFDPLRRGEPETGTPLEQREPGGLGIHLVRTLFDRVEYSRRGRRNRIAIVLAGAVPEGPAGLG